MEYSAEQLFELLNQLDECNLLLSRGKGRATYYIAGDMVSTLPRELSTPPRERITEELKRKIASLGKRVNDKRIVKDVILKICQEDYFSSKEIALLLGKREDYVKRRCLSTMIKNKELICRHPEMINHPDQAYRANL